MKRLQRLGGRKETLSLSTEKTAPSFGELRTTVSETFTVKDAYIDPVGVPTFVIEEADKHRFLQLVKAFSKYSVVPTLRRHGDDLLIRVFPRPVTKQRKTIYNWILFAATVFTVVLAGYFLWSQSTVQRGLVGSQSGAVTEVGLFTLSLFAIIGLHEIGHKIACEINGMESTMPYFIPGIPPTGTFGAVISLRSPPTNRDSLFDLGFSGPFVGFVSIVIVSILSIQMSFLIPTSQAELWERMGLIQTVSWPQYPLLFDLLIPIVRGIPQGFTLFFTQIEFAAWVGSLVSFLNLLPVWQLDGGHMSRAVLGPKWHKIAGWVGLGVMVLSGFWAFALLLSIMMMRGGRGMSGVEPLDDISELSKSRRILWIATLAMMITTFVSIG
ncbi:MAG: site-2 protease family protein [archaeon]